jgi:hypothetical protein
MTDKKHKIVFINGPKGSGKDTAADEIVRSFSARKYGMKYPIRDAIRGFLDIDDLRDYNAFFESREAKDKPANVTFGLTPREMLISFSEDWAKQKFGDDVFGRLAVRRLSGPVGVDITAISDIGFRSEMVPVIDRFGADNCFLIRLYRPGHDYAGDSRGYVDPEGLGINYIDIHNRYPLDVFQAMIRAVVAKI